MATLVFTAVGTALGGPLGGAIGSLLGQSIDQQWLGSSRKGPRLGDLSVQTSSYGTQVPRIYGTMRIAGSVIWATDLQESTAQVGAKGQPETTVYSYSVSFAVALSSRPVGAIKRIWADGKLLRGEAGDFKVSTEFRFYPGSEDQHVDPLIASLEGISETPAFRGIAVAVFENLELAEYGNRIPFLTFETEAEPGAVAIGDMLRDASNGAIACSAVATVGGYAAYGASVGSAIEPLVERFGVNLFDDGTTLRSPTAVPPLIVGEDELGASADEQSSNAIERSQSPARALPAAITLTYYDPQRDFQTGQMRASVGEVRGATQTTELAAVLDAAGAKAIVEGELARRWVKREKVTLRLMRGLDVEPGALVRFEGQLWSVQRTVLDRMVMVLELQPEWVPSGSLPADAGRALAAPDAVAGATSLAVFELPESEADAQSASTLYLAAASAVPGWRALAVDGLIGGTPAALRTAARQSVLGKGLAALPPGPADIIDDINSVEVALVDADQWLESCDEAALIAGGNLSVLGDELLQFGSAVPNGRGRFILSRLVRGRRGTEWAASGHAAGEQFALLLPGSMQAIRVPQSLVGTEVEVRPRGPGDEGALAVKRTVRGEALRPPSPVHLEAIKEGAGGLMIRWTRRSRLGWAWLDEIDAPLGEGREAYRVIIDGAAGRVERETGSSLLALSPSELSLLGAGNATVRVQQIGDFAMSRTATLTFSN